MVHSPRRTTGKLRPSVCVTKMFQTVLRPTGTPRPMVRPPSRRTRTLRTAMRPPRWRHHTMFVLAPHRTFVMVRPHTLLLGIHALAPSARSGLARVPKTPGTVPETECHMLLPAPTGILSTMALPTTIPGINALPASPRHMVIQRWGGRFGPPTLIQRWGGCSKKSSRLGSMTGRSLHATGNSVFLIYPASLMTYTMAVRMASRSSP